MTEAQSGEVEKVLLYLGDARDRARLAEEKVARDEGDEHVVAALRDVAHDLDDMHRRLTQQTFYAIPERAGRLAV